MKQTAVEWLSNELYEKFEMRGDGLLYDDILKQAKEMEKQQMKDAVASQCTSHDGLKRVFESQFNKYYNETFNKP